MMENEIIHTRIYSQSAMEIWEYLTQSELMELWLMPNNFQLGVGNHFEFKTKPMPDLDLDGIMHCIITEIIPFEKLSYTWKAGPGNGLFVLETIVEWYLEPIENGTKLTLKHSGFKQKNIDIFKGMNSGWTYLVEKMTTLINNSSK